MYPVTYHLLAAVAAAAAAGLVGLAVCELSNPMLYTFWEAARRGDDATVSAMLRVYNIPVNTQHHVTGSSLVIELAEIAATSQTRDRRLAAVLRVLVQHGWTLARQRRVTNENPLHILAAHPNRVYIKHRLDVLLSVDCLQPAQHSMLAARDWFNQRPEEKAGADRHRLRRKLRHARQAAQHAAQQRRQGNGARGS